MRSPTAPVQRLLAALETSLRQSGWEETLIQQATARVSEEDAQSQAQPTNARRRSGNLQTQNQHVVDDVVKFSRPKHLEQSTTSAVDGEKQVSGAGINEELEIPKDVADAAVALLREELMKLCEVDDDKYVDWRTTL